MPPVIPPAVLDEARLAALGAYNVLDTAPEPGFDDIVHLACRLCSAPVALVSFVDRERQWFKARVGFPECETDLDRSVCAHALAHPDELLVIPDLTADPRTAANPLVTGEPFIRFYAGAPLVTPDRDVLGSLCVIDTKPRPGGLMGSQADDLRALARQVMGQLGLRRGLREREEALGREREAVAALRQGEARLRASDERLQMALAASGVVGLWDWMVDTNLLHGDANFARLYGLDPERTAAGITMEQYQEHVVPEDVGPLRARIRDTFERGADFLVEYRLAIPGRPLRWVECKGRLIHDEAGRPVRFSGTAIDLTERKHAEAALRESQAALALERGLLGSVLEQAPVGVALAFADGRASFNARAKAMLGQEPGEGDARYAAYRAVHEDGRRYTPEEYPTLRALRQGEVVQREPMRYCAADGTLRHWEISSAPIRDEAGSIVAAVSLFADVEDQRQSEEALRQSEEHWRGLFARLSEGFIVGEVIRDGGGRVTDWRYLEVNPAWGRLVGIDHATAAGRTIRELFPGIEDEWVMDFARVVDTREGVVFTRQVGNLCRWYEGRAFPLEGERFGVIFLEVTARVEAEARRAALLSVSDRVRELASIPEMTRAAAEVVGLTLGATRAGFGVIEGDVEAIVVEPDWTAPGVASIAGRHVFDEYGDLRGDLRRGEALVIDDVRIDPRTASDPAAMLALGIGSLVNMPVRERGRTVAVFIAHDAKARHWTPEELAFLRNVADRLESGVTRVRSEEMQAVLNGELAHRLKNTLALVQSIASQTLRGVSEQDQVEAFTRRVLALSRAHDVLLQKSWAAARMRAVMEGVLALQAGLDRFAFDGPDMDLTPQAALSLTLLLHELATNAVKHGALSVQAGTVGVSWRTEDGGSPSLVLDWTERGGPAAVAPTGRAGFGSKLIRMGLMGSRQSDIRYEPEGLKAEFRAPLAELQAHVQ